MNLASSRADAVRPPIPTAILASGNGSNLAAVIEAANRGDLPLDVRIVISNNAGARAIERAANAGVEAQVLAFDPQREDRDAYAKRLAAAIKERSVELVLLLGWMHVLAPAFLRAGFTGVLNLHPAYLPEDPKADTVEFPDGVRTPAFRGAHALRDALAAGVPCTGASLIQITADVDRGPVLARMPMPLTSGEDEASALERLHVVERDVVRTGILRWMKAQGKRR